MSDRKSLRYSRNSKLSNTIVDEEKDEEESEEELICCVHGLPCEMKVPEPKEIHAKAVSPIELYASIPNVRASSQSASDEGDPGGYVNLDVLNEEVKRVQAPPPLSADDNKFNYGVISEDLKANYE